MDPSTIVVSTDTDDEPATPLVPDVDEPAPPATQPMLDDLDEPAPLATQVVSFAGTDAESTSASPLLDTSRHRRARHLSPRRSLDWVEETMADPLLGSCSLGPSESEDEVYYYIPSNIMYYNVVLHIMYY
jgi:hypothetical protein